MIVAIHQPNFLPWPGYFYKMARADCFVLLDSVPFSKRSYTNRVKIKSPCGEQWLTVPTRTKSKFRQLITSVECDATQNWRRKVLESLRYNYHRCEFFAEYSPRIFEGINTPFVNLAQWNTQLITILAESLGLTPWCTYSSEMSATGTATDLLIALCRELGADTYLSGPGGRNYQDVASFKRAEIVVQYTDFEHPIYPQAFEAFNPGMSVVDLLFNCGPRSREILLGGST